MAAVNPDAHGAKLVRHFIRTDIRTGDPETHFVEHLRNRAHTDAADTDEMNVLET